MLPQICIKGFQTSLSAVNVLSRCEASHSPHCPAAGAALLAHPGEDASGDIIVVSAPRCTLLRATEELGLCKPYRNGDIEAFSYSDRDNFKDSGT